jgi:hypothetical protein
MLKTFNPATQALGACHRPMWSRTRPWSGFRTTNLSGMPVPGARYVGTLGSCARPSAGLYNETCARAQRVGRHRNGHSALGEVDLPVSEGLTVDPGPAPGEPGPIQKKVELPGMLILGAIGIYLASKL